MIGSLPEAWQVGHRFADRAPGDTTIVIRTDTAGYSAWLIEECQARNLEFSIGHPVTQTVRNAFDLVQEEHWTPARNSDGEPRRGAEVTELTHLVDQLPAGVRMIARRERPHPGRSCRSLTTPGWRHQVFITNSPGRTAGLERRHRQRGTAEQTIRDLKATGATNLPFAAIALIMGFVALRDDDGLETVGSDGKSTTSTVTSSARRASRCPRYFWAQTTWLTLLFESRIETPNLDGRAR